MSFTERTVARWSVIHVDGEMGAHGTQHPNPDCRGFYHVMARGNRREKIFADDDDRRFFLGTLAEACGMTGWRVHAWVLMGNHYHLFIETPEANLVQGMQWLQNAYTRRFNVRHRKWGRLFGDRYSRAERDSLPQAARRARAVARGNAVIVEGSAGDYYRTLMDYIHLNPVRARIIEPRGGQSVMDYPWSSVAGGYALPASRRAKWLAAGHGLGVMAPRRVVRVFGLKPLA